MNSNSIDKMKHKAILPLLVSMALPPMFSMLIQSLYNIVDSMFVAQYSKDALTAVSLAFPIQTLMIACSVGIGVGVNSYMARKLGEQDHQEVNHTIMHGLFLAAVVYAAFAVMGIIAVPPFFKMFTSDPNIYQDACIYTYICVFFSFGCFFHICIEKVFQAMGRMMVPTIIQAIGAITNIILDPIMIFGFFGLPAMGIKGAAIATILGQILSMVLSFYVLIKKTKQIQLQWHFKVQIHIIKKILEVGVPNACMNAFRSVCQGHREKFSSFLCGQVIFQ